MPRRFVSAGRIFCIALCGVTLLASVSFAAETPPPPAAGASESEEPEEGFTPPQIIVASQRAPVYPPAALAARFGASVTVEVRVLTDGSVGNVKVVECTHPRVGFEQASIAAVEKWRFEPAMRHDVAVADTLQFSLHFSVTGAGPNARPSISAGAAGSDQFDSQFRELGDTSTADRSRRLDNPPGGTSRKGP